LVKELHNVDIQPLAGLVIVTELFLQTFHLYEVVALAKKGKTLYAE